MTVEHTGRLELTWTNKHLRLLADEDGGYHWVTPADYRVAARIPMAGRSQVTLLREA